MTNKRFSLPQLFFRQHPHSLLNLQVQSLHGFADGLKGVYFFRTFGIFSSHDRQLLPIALRLGLAKEESNDDLQIATMNDCKMLVFLNLSST